MRIIFWTSNGAYDGRTTRGQQKLDDEVLRILKSKSKTMSLYEFVVKHTDYWHGGHMGRNKDRIEASCQRLVVAGKILPFTGDGHLIPC